MTTNLKKITVGFVEIQSGNGIPDHDSTLGSIYTDIDSGLSYKNNNGASIWVQEIVTEFTGGTVDGLTATTISATTYSGDGSQLTGVVHAFTGVTSIDFGFPLALEGDFTTTAVTNSNIIASSFVLYNITPSTDHAQTEDSLLDGLVLSTSNIVDGVGFTINAIANNNTWGVYNVSYKIIN